MIFLCTLAVTSSCESQKQPFSSPAGYHLNNPKRFTMPYILREISGITFYHTTGDTLYAEQDEEARIFRFRLDDTTMRITRFGKKGDFEDISVVSNYVVMLRSDGVLFTIPLSEMQNEKTDKAKVFKDLLPDGEYEGLYSDEISKRLYILCKHCRKEKMDRWGGGTILQIDAAGKLTPAGNFELDIKQIEAIAHSGKINFHPSGLAQNPITKEWFIISSVNKMLVVTDQNWKVNSVYPLNPSLFVQPEGIAFDRQQNLYISNERGLSSSATILLFVYNKN